MRRTDKRSYVTRAASAVPIAALLLLAGVPGTGRTQEQAQANETGAPGGLQEVVVTATRREESLSRVPISVTALTQESLDDRGIKDFSEVARFTPGVNFDNSGTNNISIRGISGTGGAGTTGIYIDDTPIQLRALAFNPDEALPKSFDLDRIEVLRGPQGTLFGSGSEGGTVRYLTTQPSLTKTSVYARAELATTQGGDPSYEAGSGCGWAAGGWHTGCAALRLVPPRRRLDRPRRPVHAHRRRQERQPPRVQPDTAGIPVGAVAEVVLHAEHLLPGSQGTQHIELLAAVFRCG